MTTRSKQIAHAQVSPLALTNVYTVPHGYTLLVKAFTLDNYGVVNANFICVSLLASGQSVGVMNSGPLAGQSTTQFPLWLVLLQGDTLQVVCTQVNVTYLISGALLPGISP